MFNGIAAVVVVSTEREKEKERENQPKSRNPEPRIKSEIIAGTALHEEMDTLFLMEISNLIKPSYREIMVLLMSTRCC